jgi:hypothetical protein
MEWPQEGTKSANREITSLCCNIPNSPIAEKIFHREARSFEKVLLASFLRALRGLRGENRVAACRSMPFVLLW